MSELHVVATIEKNRLEEVRVALTEFNGHLLVDIRTFADIDGERRATKKGVSLNRAKLPELIAALKAAERGGGAC